MTNITQPPAASTVNNLGDLADLPRWVAWRTEERRKKDGSVYKTKIPRDPHTGREARIPTDPATWGTRAQAERRWSRLNDGRPGGIGFVLGDLGNGFHLMGIDLDQCITKHDDESNLDLDPFANEILE